MAMTLRLNEEETEALRSRAASEGRSMQAIARQAISDYLAARPARLASAIDRIAREDAELLERLGK